MQWKAPIFIIIALLLNGCSLFSTGSNEYSEEFILQAEKRAESYLRANYQNVDEVTFSDDHSSPMGGLVIRGKVNGEAAFSLDIDDSLNVIAISEGTEFPEEKEACKDKTCNY